MSEKIVQLNEEVIKGQIKELVRGSVEEALIEMYLAGVSVRRVEDITEALWGSKVSPATISELNKKAYVHIEDWRNRPLQGATIHTSTWTTPLLRRWIEKAVFCWQPRSQTARPKQSEINGGCIVAAAVYLIQSPVPNQQTDLTQKN